MNKTFIFLRRHVVFILVVLALVGGGSYYLFKSLTTTATVVQYASIDTVKKGTVSSGIAATGQIVAAHKLDLNVYKQTERIQAVNIANGTHVQKGDVLISFDKSTSNASVENSRVSVLDASLSLDNARKNYTDPNTQIVTLGQDIETLTTATTQAESDKNTAYRDFLNANLTAEPGNDVTSNKKPPTISGLYSDTKTGTYKIKVYNSGATSGFSYTTTGVEESTESIVTGVPTALGTHGLQILFQPGVQNNDEWTVTLPNTAAPEYIQNKENYDKKIASLNTTIAGNKVTIASKQQQIKDLGQTDSTGYRDLSVSKAQAGLASARVQLSSNIDALHEQDIIAPFAGTVEGLSNVVVGAVPTRATNDPTVLGTLISDEFLVTFSLNAVDTAKVQVGQKVEVGITSFPRLAPRTGTITEISSLPDSTGVAQYTVKALLQNDASSTVSLREGLLATVTVVQKEATDVLRIPQSAINYTNNQPMVEMLGTVSDAEKQQIAKSGVLSSATGVFPSYSVPVTLGVRGSFYAEVTSGLKEGDTIIVSKSDTAKAVVQQRGPGQGGGGGGNNGGGTRTTTQGGGGATQTQSSGAPRD